MDKYRLIEIMDNPALLTDIELPILKELSERYSYSPTLRTMYVQALHIRKDVRSESELKKAAISAPDRKQLYYLIDASKNLNPEKSEEKKHTADTKDDSSDTSKRDTKTTDIEPVNVEKTIGKTKTADDLELEKQYLTQAIESTLNLEVGNQNELPSRDELTSLKITSKKPVKKAAPKSFSDFISGASFEKDKEPAAETNSLLAKKDFFRAEKMAQNSLIDRDDFITETLADIYLRQGYYQKAIESFEKLSLNYPEKRAYFVDRIEKINKAIN